MSTATLAPNDPVRGMVRVLMALRDENQADVIEATGIPKRTFIRRMKYGGGWTVKEVQTLAEHFDTSVAVLVGGPDPVLAAIYGNTTAEYVGDIFGGPAASADYLAGDLELVA
jgi:hypothetical protein